MPDTAQPPLAERAGSAVGTTSTFSANRVGARLEALSSRRISVASVGLVVLMFLVVGWYGIVRIGDSGAYDSEAFKEYAAMFRVDGRLPSERENYEYSLPPGYPLLGAYLDRVTEWADLNPGRPLGSIQPWARRLVATLLAGFAFLMLVLARKRSPTWFAGLAAAVVTAVWAAFYVLEYVHEQPWAAKVLMTLILTAGLVVVSALLAHEAWPEHAYAPVLAAAATALLPAVLRMGHVFHPDPLFALLAATALLLVVRARRLGWTVERGIAVGGVLGSTALVRQSAPVVFVALGVAVIVLGRRQALRYGLVALVAAGVVAGPWWGYQTSRFGNLIESNLDRPGYMLDRQPRSFFVSLPLPDIVTHPYREAFKNQLLPRFHADLWSDWLGAEHSWQTSTRADRVVAGTQSVLGLGGDALVLGGLLAFGLPALRRAIRSPAVGSADAILAAGTLYFLLGWGAYIVTLVRFPQTDGDPIQAHYLLFLAPVAGLFAVGSARWAWARNSVSRGLLVVWLGLFLCSFVALLVTTYS